MLLKGSGEVPGLNACGIDNLFNIDTRDISSWPDINDAITRNVPTTHLWLDITGCGTLKEALERWGFRKLRPFCCCWYNTARKHKGCHASICRYVTVEERMEVRTENGPRSPNGQPQRHHLQNVITRLPDVFIMMLRRFRDKSGKSKVCPCRQLLTMHTCAA